LSPPEADHHSQISQDVNEKNEKQSMGDRIQ